MFKRIIAILAIVLFLFFFFAFCAKAQPDNHSYTCGDLVIALDKNDNYVLVNSAADATQYLRTYWSQIASDPNAMHEISVYTVQVCEAAVKEQASDIPIKKVLQAVAVQMEGTQ
jgi:hypothetical protein